METAEKAKKIEEAMLKAASLSEFGSANLNDVCRFAQRHGIEGEETQQYLAVLAAQNVIKTSIIGHSFYIIPNQN